MATALAPLVNVIGGSFLGKAAGHAARAKRASGEKETAAQESQKLGAVVSYECVRRIDASINAGTSHPLYLNFGKAGGKTGVGDEIACFHAAQDLGAAFTGREFDDAAGQPLRITHPEFYDNSFGVVPSNTGSPGARGAASGIQQAVSDTRTQGMPGVIAANGAYLPAGQSAPSQQNGTKNILVIILVSFVALLGLVLVLKD